jgi:glycosyltransferase involved in cell wall biosynthesis
VNEYVSILMLTHNAPTYVETSVRTVAAMTRDVRYELVVVDNASELETKSVVNHLASAGLITKLKMLDHNSLFAGGNNIAAEMTSPDATHFLLLNSDIEIRDCGWLRRLLDTHKRGATSFGWVDCRPCRLDGYCLLVDADLYRKYRLDEAHQWFWSVTKLQAALLHDGHSVQGYRHHERYLHHFGGKSGKSFRGAKGMDVTLDHASTWFRGKRPTQLDETPYEKLRRAALTLIRRT